MRDYETHFIGGKWVAGTAKNSIDVLNPATEQRIGRVPSGTAEDIDAAARAARAAFEGWSTTPPAERAAVLLEIHEGLAARADEIAETITAEVGMPIKLSKIIQAGSPIGQFKGMAKVLSAYEFEQDIRNSRIVREAVGVVGCITPWNYPLHQIAAKVAPALAAGCTVVLKPSEVAPLNAIILAEVIAGTRLPAGVFNLVNGEGPVVGEAIARHKEIDMVSFTGSTRAGRRVSELAAATVKRVTLELGGKSAAILLDDADMTKAVKGVFGACYLNSGQTCTAHTRMLIPENRYDEVAELAKQVAAGWTVGDPTEDGTRLGPLVSAAQRERVQRYIKQGVDEGAELLCGGPDTPAGQDQGYFVQPTVFGRVAPESTIAQEEIFGPVLSILTYKDEDDAVAIANDSLYGLSGGVWSADQDRALRVARRLRTGMVDINGGAFNPSAPFGGYKQSGIGREFGEFGLEEFLEVKSIQL
ncbi:MAG: aldehyde dehydrogenase family protein [Alphaproteobacteria bacterium]|nr:aldehyde dehydrogenase family protein [Alphaproteobacteria bacterium]